MHALQAGDAVRARVYSSAGRVERIIVDAVVREPASVRELNSLPGACITLELHMPDGQREVKSVPCVYVLPAATRCPRARGRCGH